MYVSLGCYIGISGFEMVVINGGIDVSLVA